MILHKSPKLWLACHNMGANTSTRSMSVTRCEMNPHAFLFL
jgi:hypothetical protein